MKRVAAGTLLGLVLGIFVGHWWGAASVSALEGALKSSLVPIQESNTGYTLVHPLLAYRTPEATTYGEYTELESALTKNVSDAKKVGSITDVSIYFRDLDTARWIGVNETGTYHPASLLKVPLLIAFYKEAEVNPEVLYQQVEYHSFSNLPAFEAPSKLVVGQSYSINELLERMSIDSDNGATFTLLDKINPDVLNEVYKALGIAVPDDASTTDYQISARTYGLFFRVLYNATYLSPLYSQKALALLSKATFTDGVAAGIPKETLVAHKYGEHVIASGQTAIGFELSDCGVVYYPKHPYLLCVMTRAKGTDLSTATSAISAISKTTYDAIAARYK